MREGEAPTRPAPALGRGRLLPPDRERAALRAHPGSSSRFALRHRLGTTTGRRYWRYVEVVPGDLEANDLEILRRIDPTGGQPVPDAIGDVDLEAAWQRAAAEVLEEHNRRADVREEQEADRPAPTLGA